MRNFKKIKNKILSIVLSFMIVIVPATSNTINIVFAAESTSKTQVAKKVEKEKSFSEKHPVFIKIFKYVGIALGVTAGVAATTTAVYYILDKINPERVIDRADRDAANQRLKEVNREILNFELGRNAEITAERVKELRKTRTSLESRVNSENSYFNAKNAAFGAAGIGGIITVAKCGMDIVNSFGEFSKNILNISNLRYSGGNFINMYKETSELLKPQPKGTSKEKALENFDDTFENFYGQEEAVLSLKSHLYDIVVGKDQAKWRGEKHSHCDIIYLYGPSGVGKSFIAKRLPRVLMMNSEPLIMSSSDVDKEKKESVVDQLFNTTNQNAENSNRFMPTKPLVRYLKNNPGGVVIFEEYDKVCTPALDEVFRTAMEQGTVNIDGEKIDCSGTTFIFTSNEDDISMEGFEKSDNEKLDKQRLSEGYTRIWHSKSFLNRIKKVKFKNLTSNEYANIITNHFEEISAYWEDSKNAGIKLNIDNKTIEELAEKVEEINQGARPIDLWIIPGIQIALGDKVKAAPNYDFYRGKSFDIIYDNQNNKLQIICEN